MMKKRFYIIISSLLLLLLSGCDAILDSVYPPDIQNNIEVRLTLSPSLQATHDFVKIQLVPLDEYHDLMLNSKITVELWTSDTIEYNFDSLPAKEYRAFAFVDLNGDDKPDWDEPSTELWNQSNYNSTAVFDFRNTTVDEQFMAAGYISEYPLINNEWLEQFNVGDYAVINNNFSIDGEFLIDKDIQASSLLSYDIIPDDPGKTIVSMQLKITDSYYTAVQYNNSYDFVNTTPWLWLGVQYFELDLSLLDPMLDDSFWSDEYFMMTIKVNYNDGESFENVFYINLN